MMRQSRRTIVASGIYITVSAVLLCGCNQDRSAMFADTYIDPGVASPEVIVQLKEDGFAIAKTEHSYLSSLYHDCKNDTGFSCAGGTPATCGLPPIITCDAMLYAYQRAMRAALYRGDRRRAYYAKYFLGMTGGILMTGPYRGLSDKDNYKRALGIVVAARMLFGGVNTGDLTGVPTWVHSEVKAITEAQRIGHSPAIQGEIDYSVCRVPQAYQATADLKGYYRAKTWLGQIRLNLLDASDRQVFCLLAMAIAEEPEASAWFDEESVGGRVSSVVLPDEAWKPLVSMDGDNVRGLSRWEIPAKVGRKKAFRLIDSALAMKARECRRRSNGQHSLQGVIMGRRVPIANYILRCTAQGRVPSGLDVLAVLHGGSAETALLESTNPSMRPALSKRLREARESLRLSGTTPIEWHTHQVLESLISYTCDPRWPEFMKTKEYRRKSLQTAAAAWAEYRGSWRLHMAGYHGVFGHSSAPSVGFVEPHAVFWDRMAILTAKSAQYLRGDDDGVLGELREIALECRLIAEKQLLGQVEERRQSDVFSRFANVLRLIENCPSEGARNGEDDGVVEPVLIAKDGVNGISLYVGTSGPRAFYCLMPIGTQYVVARGGVMRYREWVIHGDSAPSSEGWYDVAKETEVSEWMQGL
jgi:hypothetical protein